MPETTAAPARVCLLDDGYSREARSLLYNAYRHEPTFAYIFEAQRPGYERRLRVMVREWVRQHFYLQLPAIGLLVEDRLIALALIVAGVWFLAHNTQENMRIRGIQSGFDFLGQPAGFDIGESITALRNAVKLQPEGDRKAGALKVHGHRWAARAALLVGATSGPTFATSPACPASNIAWISDRAGCSPHCTPPAPT